MQFSLIIVSFVLILFLHKPFFHHISHFYLFLSLRQFIFSFSSCIFCYNFFLSLCVSLLVVLYIMFGRIVRGRSNGFTLIFKGYRYNISNPTDKAKTKTFWRCVQKEGNMCKGTIITEYLNKEEPPNTLKIVQEKNLHTHASDAMEERVGDVIRGIKRRALDRPNERPLKIVQEELETVRNEEVLPERLPERRNLLRLINRQQNMSRPTNPISINELQILQEYQRTISNSQFLQYDSGIEDENRILIFYTEDALRHLTQSHIVLSDGTFKVVPLMFNQLYTLHAEVRGYVFPMVYALTVRKNAETYRIIFEHVKNHANQLDMNLAPEKFMTDMEKAVINVTATTFPGTINKICLFHWCKAIWRKFIEVTYVRGRPARERRVYLPPEGEYLTTDGRALKNQVSYQKSSKNQ